jgi:hypothetical protein
MRRRAVDAEAGAYGATEGPLFSRTPAYSPGLRFWDSELPTEPHEANAKANSFASIEKHPDYTPTEHAKAMKVSPNQVYGLAGKLQAGGKINQDGERGPLEGQEVHDKGEGVVGLHPHVWVS